MVVLPGGHIQKLAADQVAEIAAITRYDGYRTGPGVDFDKVHDCFLVDYELKVRLFYIKINNNLYNYVIQDTALAELGLLTLHYVYFCPE